MRRNQKGRNHRGRGAFLFAAAMIAASSMNFEGVFASEDSYYAAETEGTSPESAYISEDLAAAQEQAVEAARQQEALKEQEAGEAVQSFVNAVRALSDFSREDTKALLELEDEYNALSEEEKDQVSSETLALLKEAEEEVGACNRSDNGVSVEGSLPWYIQFFATLLPDEGKVSDNTWIVVPYEMELKDARTDEVYHLSEGESVTVTMPVPDTALRGQFVVYHKKSDGSVENIVPKIEGDMMSFEATSFSTYFVAGSSVVAGIGITTDFILPEESTEDETSSEEVESESTEGTEEVSEDQSTGQNGNSGNTSNTGQNGNSGSISSTEQNENNGNISNPEQNGNSSNSSGTENNGISGNTPDTENNTGSETSNQENTGSSDNTGSAPGAASSSETGSTQPQMSTDGTPQTDPSVPLQASPAQTGDETEILYLVILSVAAFLILSGSAVMKKRG